VTLSKGNGIFERYREADVGMMIPAAEAFIQVLQPQLQGRRFRLVFVSGWVAERDLDKSLWIGEAARRSKVGFFLCYDIVSRDMIF
jgi:hypothetical protein